ncbi:alkylphosphonate utilization protein [Zhongshania sp.]|uniref:PhnA domain-containing protein n=1 Tax=Zhongshania sp. TaxID=1971902 RepID=UPI001B556182|nr:alkylphosphonate utilization protein [Zhongshania sp.]MBQ0796791.1 PhnA domain-containing protein [Zhongshania sp.]
MNTEQALIQRSDSRCELCASSEHLTVFAVPPYDQSNPSHCIMACALCTEQLLVTSELDTKRWHSLNDTVWSAEPAIQVLSYRLLKRLASEPWAQDLLDTVYLDEETQAWADALNPAAVDDVEPTLDSNGVQLMAGDTVVLIKDLDVKGTSFVAKRGTAVRGISLTNNPEHIEGRVNGTRIVIISAYVKKSN